MTDSAGKCNINNTMLSQNAFSVNTAEEEERQENDFIDDKVQIFETGITAGLQDNFKCEEIKQYDKSIISYNIKTELPSSEVQYDIVHDNLKIEKGLGTDDIKIEFNNGFLYCEDCQIYCEHYCTNCGMLVLILNRTVPINADDKSREQLLNDILEIREYCGEFRIFALKSIPEGVKFGPFTGPNRTELSWKINGGKIVVNEDKSKCLNWMQYISAARNISEQNLLVFQYKHNLYYQSTRHIQEGDELLVYFGEEYDDSLKRNVEVDFIPTTEHNFKDAFACTYCCLGFSSKSYLNKHKAICCGNVDGGFSVEELVQCPSCEIHLDQKEYFTYHMLYCCERYDGKCILSAPDDRTTQVSRRRIRHHQMYKCQQCEYRTKYKGELKKHTNQHYKAKTRKCGFCCRRFKTKDILKLHVENTHIGAVRKGTLKEFKYKCAACDYKSNRQDNLKRHILTKHSKEFKFKCETCDYKSNQKSSLKTHIQTRHLKELKYKCDMCDFKSNWKLSLKTHIETRHLKEFKYKCDRCDYKSNHKSSLKTHVETRHLKELKYKCDTCDFKSNWKLSLKTHIETRHLKQFKYKCDMCDYKSNLKVYLKTHIDSKHLKEFKYKCDSCDYKSNWKTGLKKHIEIRHLQEFKYKCDRCDYKSNLKIYLKEHTERRHLDEFKYKCDACDYKSNQKGNLKTHIKTRHLKEFKYSCDSCDYKSNKKFYLKTHIETRHLKEFKYKCDRCDYKSNLKDNLKTHIEARHLKEFKYKCDRCDYKSNLKIYLKRHTERRHLKEFKYKCESCDMKSENLIA